MNNRQAQALLRDVLRFFSALWTGAVFYENGACIGADSSELFVIILKVAVGTIFCMDCFQGEKGCKGG